MAIRLIGVMRDALAEGDLDVWNAFAAAGLDAGLCDCGGTARGERITRRHTLAFAAVACRRCGAEAAVPVRPLSAAAA